MDSRGQNVAIVKLVYVSELRLYVSFVKNFT